MLEQPTRDKLRALRLTGMAEALEQQAHQPDAQGLAFAIPAKMVSRFLDEARTYGRFRHVRLGIRAENAGPDALPGRARVVRVTQVESRGPAAKAGLRKGDFLLSVDGVPVSRVSDVAYLTQLHGVGSSTPVTIRRGESPPERLVLTPDEAP